jgi:hypothetical protein
MPAIGAADAAWRQGALFQISELIKQKQPLTARAAKGRL